MSFKQVLIGIGLIGLGALIAYLFLTDRGPEAAPKFRRIRFFNATPAQIPKVVVYKGADAGNLTELATVGITDMGKYNTAHSNLGNPPDAAKLWVRVWTDTTSGAEKCFIVGPLDSPNGTFFEDIFVRLTKPAAKYNVSTTGAASDVDNDASKFGENGSDFVDNEPAMCP